LPVWAGNKRRERPQEEEIMAQQEDYVINTGRLARAIMSIKNVHEKFAKIQEDPAFHGAENGLTAQELEILDKLIAINGEAMLAADAIIKKILGNR
jgi:hypothetical protein